jgi:hypothetical protein
MTLAEAQTLALKVLKQVMEEKLDENNVQLAQVSVPSRYPFFESIPAPISTIANLLSLLFLRLGGCGQTAMASRRWVELSRTAGDRVCYVLRLKVVMRCIGWCADGSGYQGDWICDPAGSRVEGCD